MGVNSAVEWPDATWNPVTGCPKVTRGCDHCYAECFAGHSNETSVTRPAGYLVIGRSTGIQGDRENQSLQAGAGVLHGQIPLESVEGRGHVEEELSFGRACVDVPRQHPERDATPSSSAEVLMTCVIDRASRGSFQTTSASPSRRKSTEAS